MMKLNDSLYRIKRFSAKRKPLIRELTASWNNDVPKSARTQIVERTLGHLIADLDLGPFPPLLADVLQVAKSRATPTEYPSAQQYLKSAVLASVFSKVQLDIPGLNPREAAVERFNEAEKLCRIANRRIIHYRKHDFASRPLVKRYDVHQVFHLARRKISEWLSRYEPEDLLEHARHGPGGCGGEKEHKVKRPFTLPYYKFAKTPQGVSQGAYFLYLRGIAKSDIWISAIARDLSSSGAPPNLEVMSLENRLQLADSVLEIVRGNDVGFVVKTFSTDRSISSEPQGSVYTQLGLGGIFRDALKLAGCDLDDQSRNQSLAYAGTVEEQDSHVPVTIDMRMASDCNPTELVRELFEPKWFELMDALRSREGRYEGKWFKWAKFSSMGNGFTFELESMIFYALAQACCDLSGETQWFSDTFGPRYKYGQLSVYGDDIIVPQGCVHHLIHVLRFCGFQTNSEKTFVSGPFRESCGSDWFSGIDVRTAYYKGDLSHIRDIVKLLNVVKYNDELLGRNGCPRLVRTLQYLRDLLSVIAPTVYTHLRNTKKTLSSSHVWCEPDEAMSSGLVHWDVDMQSWLMPEIRTRLNPEKGSARWRYVQFMYAATGSREPIEDTDLWEDLVKRNPLAAALSGGGSAGDIMLAARAGDGKLGFVSRCEALTDLDSSFISWLEHREMC